MRLTWLAVRSVLPRLPGTGAGARGLSASDAPALRTRYSEHHASNPQAQGAANSAPWPDMAISSAFTEKQ